MKPFTIAFTLLLALLLGITSCEKQPTAQATDSPPAYDTVSTRNPGRTLNAGFLIVNGVFNSELFAPFDILHHTRYHADPWIEVFTVAPDTHLITTFEGNQIKPNYTFTNSPKIDILVVPSAEHSMDTDLENAKLIEFVTKTGEKAVYIMSLCDGAFVLAETGLLDELHATTFPGDIAAFRKRYGDRIAVEEGPSFVHHGKAITSNGGAKSYDPAMYLVEYLYGTKAAIGVGRGMVIDWPSEKAEHLVF